MLSITIFLFIHFLLKKKSIPVSYIVFFFVFYIFTGTARDISSKMTNELIVYNTPGTSTIGIRTGKILNLFSDTSVVGPEVKRHCATLGLKIKSNVLKNKYYCLKTGGKKVLITSILNKNMIQQFMPDFLVITGSKPEIENDLKTLPFRGKIIVSSEASSGFHMSQRDICTDSDSIHFVRKSGAFIRNI
jgi:hypothetical protein